MNKAAKIIFLIEFLAFQPESPKIVPIATEIRIKINTIFAISLIIVQPIFIIPVCSTNHSKLRVYSKVRLKNIPAMARI